MKWSFRHRKLIGFTMVEILLGTALTALTVAMAVKLLPSFVTPNTRIIDQNNLGSLTALREIVRSDLSQSNAGAVMEDKPASLYICRYNPNGRCVRLDQSSQQIQQQNHARYCIASSSAGDLQGEHTQINRFVMYRGRGASFEYFYAQNNMNDFSEINLGSRNGSSSNDEETIIHQVLQNLCEVPFESTPVGLRNASWIRLNNPDVMPLQSFMLCGVNNNSFPDLLNTSPPNQCLPPGNQTGSGDVDCRPGENGLNALMLYYRFQRNLNGNQAVESGSSQTFSDVVLVNFSAKPCILR